MASMELCIEGAQKLLEPKRRGYTITSMVLWSLYSSTQFSIATPGFADDASFCTVQAPLETRLAL